MGLAALREELSGVFGDADGSSCCNLSDLIRGFAEEVGIDFGFLMEAVKCDPKCRAKYTNQDGTFKGHHGDSAESCKKMFATCCKGVRDPGAICAYIGRRAGRA